MSTPTLDQPRGTAGGGSPIGPGLARRPWLAPVGVGAVTAMGLAYVAWQDPNADGIYPQCPTQELFGVDCPGCGGLRAVHALTRGDLAAAADHNLLVVVMLPIMVALWARWLLKTLGLSVPRLPRVPKAAWIGLALAVVAFSVARNIGGVGLFEYLASTA